MTGYSDTVLAVPKGVTVSGDVCSVELITRVSTPLHVLRAAAADDNAIVASLSLTLYLTNGAVSNQWSRQQFKS